MPIYDIYALGESDISLSGGAILDGVTQGDGSHLVPDPPADPITLTINAANWQAMSINDSDDSDFGDSDASQTLNGTQTFDGVEYTGNPRVEAEYSFTVTDGVNTWTLVAFNINNSSPAYGTVEGIAVIGGPGSFPPVGVELTITGANEGPNFIATEYSTPICLVEGTRVACVDGARPVETLEVGMVVETAGHGPQPVRWVGTQYLPAEDKMAPVRFEPGVLGNERALMVSQQHRVLVRGWPAQLLLGRDEALVPAGQLVNGRTVTRVTGGMVRYFHVLLDVHALLICEGALCESLYPGDMALTSVGAEEAEKILAAVPETAPEFAAPLVTGREAHSVADRL